MDDKKQRQFGNYLRRQMHRQLDCCEPPVQVRQQILDVARVWQRTALHSSGEIQPSIRKESKK